MAFDDREMELQRAHFQAKLAAEKQKIDVVRKVKRGQGDFVLLDTRDRASWEKEHIPGALALPLEEVEDLAPGLDKGKEYVTYCWHRT
ncbi:MAG TPA: rhodanese-like domain-containing protein [Planctomycetota bacterium]|nr:rhodanese-like domain-containing protein [Planctomycetota bacterium]